MPETYNENNVARLKHLASLGTRVNSELGATFRSASVSGNTVSFFNSKDGTGTAAFTFDFPEEMFLSQTGTELVDNFTFSTATYPGATDPNLNGKPVLVLAVRGNALTPTTNYSFVSLERLIDVYTAGDNSININGYNVSVKRSAATGNLIELKNDGLFVGSDDTKADKVANATAGNIATLDANGNLVDSGVTFASDADVNTMLTNVFGASS